MTKEKFPYPSLWLDIETCQLIYETYRLEASKRPDIPQFKKFETRYPNRLESILFSVEARSRWSSLDVVSTAVRYFVRLVRSQAFLDGNKRMAIFYTNTYLYIHGFKLDLQHKLLTDIALLVSKDNRTNEDVIFNSILSLFEKHVKKTSHG